MKQINQIFFEDEEFEQLLNVKYDLNLNWHDFIMLLAERQEKK